MGKFGTTRYLKMDEMIWLICFLKRRPTKLPRQSYFLLFFKQLCGIICSHIWKKKALNEVNYNETFRKYSNYYIYRLHALQLVLCQLIYKKGPCVLVGMLKWVQSRIFNPVIQVKCAEKGLNLAFFLSTGLQSTFSLLLVYILAHTWKSLNIYWHWWVSRHDTQPSSPDIIEGSRVMSKDTLTCC